jgi:hypothetical protein
MDWTAMVRFPARAGILLLATVSRPTHGPTQWLLGGFPPEVKRSVPDADHSPTSSAALHSHCFFCFSYLKNNSYTQ